MRVKRSTEESKSLELTSLPELQLPDVRRQEAPATGLRVLSEGRGNLGDMASWEDVVAAAPDLAAAVRARFEATKHKTMATLRKDGSPRISGTETAFTDGELTLGSMPGALKARDLLRDDRIAVHSATVDPPPGDDSGWVGEAKVAGRAVPMAPTPDQPDAHVFRLDLTEVVLTRLTEDGKALQIESWHPDHGYRVRRRE